MQEHKVDVVVVVVEETALNTHWLALRAQPTQPEAVMLQAMDGQDAW